MPEPVSIAIPHYGTLSIRHVVLDYNGTLAKDGELLPGLRELLKPVCERFYVHVITSDTFGTVAKAFEGSSASIKVLQSNDHTGEKASYLEGLGAAQCVAVGNGNNDVRMLETAGLGIALLGDEGCATKTLLASDIVCKSIEDVVGLLLCNKRIVATLRR